MKKEKKKIVLKMPPSTSSLKKDGIDLFPCSFPLSTTINPGNKAIDTQRTAVMYGKRKAMCFALLGLEEQHSGKVSCDPTQQRNRSQILSPIHQPPVLKRR